MQSRSLLLALTDAAYVCGWAQLMAKCETRQSLFNFQSIAQASDAIIMSRGNLGLDVLPEKMALVQKAVISNCNLIGKPVLITRVVDTMVNTPRPTRCACFLTCNLFKYCAKFGLAVRPGTLPLSWTQTAFLKLRD